MQGQENELGIEVVAGGDRRLQPIFNAFSRVSRPSFALLDADPDAYAAMREYWNFRGSAFIAVAGPLSGGEREYERRRRPLEESFVQRLRLGELMASGIPEGADVTAPRTLIDPELLHYAHLNFEVDYISTRMGAKLLHVEIFEPPGVPRNVRIIPEWYWEQIEPAQSVSQPFGCGAGETQGQLVFRQEADYRRVWIYGVGFSLTRTQACVVKILHEAYLKRAPWLSGKTVLKEAGSASMQMFHVFRSHKTPHWRLLIESDGRRMYRLNIRE